MYSRIDQIVYEGVEYPSVKALCIAIDIPYAKATAYIRKGLSIEDAVNKVKSNIVSHTVEFDGKVYSGYKALADAYNVNISTFYNRKRKGLPIEECIQPSAYSSYRKVEYNGKVYPTLSALCREHNLNKNTIITRIKRGYTMEEALNNENFKHGRGNHDGTHVKKSVVVDGITYSSIREMLNERGIKENTFYVRLKRGWTIEEAAHGYRNKFTVTDKSGRTFNNIKSALEANGITYSQYMGNIASGMDKTDAVSELRDSYSYRKAVTYKGVTYNSIRELCDAYGVSYSRYVQRLRAGFSIDEALNNKRYNRSRQTLDKNVQTGNAVAENVPAEDAPVEDVVTDI